MFSIDKTFILEQENELSTEILIFLFQVFENIETDP